jgi:hypothetical protein
VVPNRGNWVGPIRGNSASKKKKEAEEAQKREEERAAEAQRQQVFQRQHVTIECPTFDYVNSRFTTETYRLTLHLEDKKTGRLDQYGMYDWSDQKWYRFEGEDENFLWLYKNKRGGTGVHYWREVEEKDGQFGTYHSTHHYQESSGSCYRWDKAIDKNNRRVTIIGAVLNQYTEAPNEDDTWLCGDAPNGSFRTSAQCTSVIYAAPPQRLGN